MKTLNKQTKDIWSENERAFIRKGNGFKQELIINDIDFTLRRDMIDLYTIILEYDIIYQLEESNLLKSLIQTKQSLSRLIEILDVNEAIILEDYENLESFAKVTIWNNDDISDIFPSMQCPNYKHRKKSFRFQKIKNYWLSYIFERVRKMWVIIRVNHKLIDVYSLIGSTYKINTFENDKIKNKIDRILASCSINEWIWKPSILAIEDSETKTIIKVNKFPYISNIKEINVEWEVNAKKLHCLFNLIDKLNIVPSFLRISSINWDL